MKPFDGADRHLVDASADWVHVSIPVTWRSPGARPAGASDASETCAAGLATLGEDLLLQIGAALVSRVQAEPAGARIVFDVSALPLFAGRKAPGDDRVAARDTTRSARPRLDDVRLKRVLDHMSKHSSDDLCVEALAAVACLSPYHFTRLFRNSMGMPPHRYWMRLRLERARQRLAAGDDPLVDIALATGFSSQSSFTRAFRLDSGVTPGEYRRTAARRAAMALPNASVAPATGRAGP